MRSRVAGARIWMLLAPLALVSCRRPTPTPAATPDPPPARGAATPRPVGMTTRTIEDHARGRRLEITIWYPAAAGTVEETTVFDGIFPARGAWGAPARATPARFPLVLLSHGSGGDPSNLAWLAEALVARGWIVAAVDHPGDRFGDESPEGRFAVWRRPADVSATLTALLADATFGHRIDRRRIAVAGHSSGATTALLLAGARLRPLDFLATCDVPNPATDCGPLAGLDVAAIPDLGAASDSYRDRRIRAAVALAPVLGPAATAASLRRIDIPVEIVAARADELIPFDANAAMYAARIPRARLRALPEGGHFVFMPVCTLPGRLVARWVCVDVSPDVDRSAVHDQTAADVTAFLERALAVRRTRVDARRNADLQRWRWPSTSRS